MEFIQLTEDEFEAQYKPIRNHLSENEHTDMFETFGKEYEFVKKINAEDPDRVWTYMDGDEYPSIVDGWAFVNRIGYFITEVPCPKGVSIEVKLGNYDDE